MWLVEVDTDRYTITRARWSRRAVRVLYATTLDVPIACTSVHACYPPRTVVLRWLGDRPVPVGD